MDKKEYFANYSARRAAVCLAALLFAGLLNSARAVESLFLAGAEASADSQYAFIAAIIPFPGSGLGNGWVQRYWLEWLTYEYESHDRVIEAESPGAEAALGYQKSHAGGYYGAYAGIYYRDIELSPDDPTANTRGSQTRFRAQAEAEQAIAVAWRVNGIVSYVFVQESYWGRARLLRTLKGPLSAGVEFIAHGDPDYKAKQVGLVLTGFEPAPRLNLGFKIGASKIEDRSTEVYVGFELGRAFGK
jgi:hypothetical protein